MRVQPFNFIPFQYSLKLHTSRASTTRRRTERNQKTDERARDPGFQRVQRVSLDLPSLALWSTSALYLYSTSTSASRPRGEDRRSRLPSNLHDLVMTRAFSLPISDILIPHVCWSGKFNSQIKETIKQIFFNSSRLQNSD